MLPIRLAVIPAIAPDKQSKKVPIKVSRAKGTKVRQSAPRSIVGINQSALSNVQAY